MATQTPNYNLDLYETGDAAALTDQYNSAMRKIDNDLKTFSQGITSASQQAATANKTADANTAKLNALGATDTSAATALKTKIDTNTAKLNALGATDTGTATALKNKIDTTATNLNALGATDTSNATALKNKINTTATNLNALGITDTSTATALKTKINTTATNLDALGITDTSTATALKTKIDTTTTNLDQNYYTKTQSDSKYVLKPTQQTNLVAIGDSYFEGFRTNNPATDSMIVKASNMLGLTCKNFAVGGSGFISNVTYSQQLDKAHSTVNPDTVKYVVIGGGRNDNSNNLTENIVRDTLNKAKTLFPNSQIVFIPMMWDNTYLGAADCEKYGVLLAGARKANTWTVQNAPTWGLYKASAMTDIHPNTAGSEIYAQYIATAIQNNMTTMSRQEVYKDVTMTGLRDSGTFRVFIDGLTIHMLFRGYKKDWNNNPFATINGANTFPVYQIITGFTDYNQMLRLKFDGHNINVIDVYPGSGAGGPSMINFVYSFSMFQKI